MDRRLIFRFALGALAALALGTGCATTGVDTEEVEQGSEFGTDSGMRGGESIPGTDIPEPDAELGVVYFDYDKYAIRGDQRAALKANAELVLAGDFRSVTIQGHCDERGSEEYNLALGERRANAVRRYLTDLGVPASKLRTVSFGEERPAVRGHDESAWRYNRRAEFGVRK